MSREEAWREAFAEADARMSTRAAIAYANQKAGGLYQIRLVVDDALISQHSSCHPMAKTLRLAAALIKGIPQAYVGIWRDGKRRAEIETNLHGELWEVTILVERDRVIRCTPMNPKAHCLAI